MSCRFHPNIGYFNELNFILIFFNIKINNPLGPHVFQPWYVHCPRLLNCKQFMHSSCNCNCNCNCIYLNIAVDINNDSDSSRRWGAEEIKTKDSYKHKEKQNTTLYCGIENSPAAYTWTDQTWHYYIVITFECTRKTKENCLYLLYIFLHDCSGGTCSYMSLWSINIFKKIGRPYTSSTHT